MNWLEFQVTLAIRLSLQVYLGNKYERWAKDWLSGKDRSKESAANAVISIYAAANAYADADAYAASNAAADSAAAATYADATAYTANSVTAAAYAVSTAATAANDSIKRSIKLGAKIEEAVKFL